MSLWVPQTPRARAWLAREALAAYAAALVLLAVVAGFRTLALLLVVIGEFVALVLGLWMALAHRGLVRAIGIGLAAGAEVVLIVAQVRADLLWVAVVATLLFVIGYVAGHLSLTPVAVPPTDGVPVPPPAHPFLIMNPRSGGGKGERFGLKDKAEALGVEVAVLDGPGHIDVAELARTAIKNGADLIGAAGGDGTQALVAQVAAEHDVPMFVVPAGTRNHFALDLGIDRDDLGASLEALTDAVELRVDLGEVNTQPFVNNVSFGAYAAIVARPDYRADKLRVSLRVLPDVISGHEGPRLTAQVDGQVLEAPQALLVSNNSYGTGDLAGMGRRLRLDEGTMGVIAVNIADARAATRLLLGPRSRDITSLIARDIVIDADTSDIPAGVDGESLMFATPVHCRVLAGALRVRVPRHRPGFAVARPPFRLRTLLATAGFRRTVPAS